MIAGHLQEKKGFYYMVLNFTDEEGKRKPKWISTGLPIKGNKRKAEAMLTEERQKYHTATYTPDADTLFADYLLYWLKAIEPQVETVTYANYKSNIEIRIAPFFRGRKTTLGKLKPIDIQEFYTDCLTRLGVSNNTVIHYHANLSAALKYALRKDMISVNPMDKVDRPKLNKHIGQFYSLTEIENLIEVVRDDGVEFPVLMAAFYGLRRSEIMGLRWQSIDFDNNRITVDHTVVQTRVDGKQVIVAKDRAKNKSSCRSLPLVPQYRELLLQIKAHQEECKQLCGKSYYKSDYVYVNDIGEPIKPNYVTQHFALVLKKNGLRKITFHELRHSCASLLLKSGVSMKEIQEWLGHSNFSTTANIYAHLDSSSKTTTGSTMADKIDISCILTDTNCHDTNRMQGRTEGRTAEIGA